MLAVLLVSPMWAGAERSEGADEEATDRADGTQRETRSRDARRERFAGFTPYLSTGPFTTIQRVKGNIQTTFGPSATPRNTLTNLGWLFELGVASPTFERLPGKPRLLAYGGILIPTNESSVMGSTALEITGPSVRTTEDTKMALEYQTSYRAGLGAEFQIEVLTARLTLTPGVQYLYLGSRYTAQASSKQFFSTGDPIERDSTAKNSLVQHFFGPSLRVTTDHIEVGPFRLDLYIEGGLLFDVAGTRQQSRFVGDGGEISTFTWEADPASGVFNAGIRLQLP